MSPITWNRWPWTRKFLERWSTILSVEFYTLTVLLSPSPFLCIVLLGALSKLCPKDQGGRFKGWDLSGHLESLILAPHWGHMAATWKIGDRGWGRDWGPSSTSNISPLVTLSSSWASTIQFKSLISLKMVLAANHWLFSPGGLRAQMF